MKKSTEADLGMGCAIDLYLFTNILDAVWQVFQGFKNIWFPGLCSDDFKIRWEWADICLNFIGFFVSCVYIFALLLSCLFFSFMFLYFFLFVCFVFTVFGVVYLVDSSRHGLWLIISCGGGGVATDGEVRCFFISSGLCSGIWTSASSKHHKCQGLIIVNEFHLLHRYTFSTSW